MSAQLSGFRRFLHWGPCTAIGIIKCITLTTLYMNSMWWPPNRTLGGFANQAIFLLFSSVATFNYVMATLTGPGLLPKNWRPKNPKHSEQLQYCKVCEGYKAPRAHHCRKCNRCVQKMDHHCPWINHCVGWANHAYFTYFLGFSIVGSFHAAIILSISFYRGINRFWYLRNHQLELATVQFNMYSIILCIFALGLSIGVVIALGMLLFFQIKSIVTNQTGIEMWIVQKAIYRRHHNPYSTEFVYPYDLGRWQNMRQVFDNACLMEGAGVEWPVYDGCDQYTLTREQIAQKAEKRARTKTYKCVRPATGRFLPLFSQGLRVCLSPPCTDEPRIRLQPDDVIKVTRFRKHWFFGERVVSNGEEQHSHFTNKKQLRKGPIRGWFPRRCVIELIEAEQKSPALSEAEEDNNDGCAAPQEIEEFDVEPSSSLSPLTNDAKQLSSDMNISTKVRNGHRKKNHLE